MINKYHVMYQISVDGDTFVNNEIVDAYDKCEAFVIAREKGEKRYLGSGGTCVSSCTMLHYNSKVVDITDMDINKEIDNIVFDELSHVF